MSPYVSVFPTKRKKTQYRGKRLLRRRGSSGGILRISRCGRRSWRDPIENTLKERPHTHPHSSRRMVSGCAEPQFSTDKLFTPNGVREPSLVGRRTAHLRPEVRLKRGKFKCSNFIYIYICMCIEHISNGL